MTEDEAKKLLQDGEISGYLKIEEEKPKVVIMANGINQTVFKHVTEEINETGKIVKNGIENEVKKEMESGNFIIDYEAIYDKVLEKIENQEANIEDKSSNNLSYMMIEFYTLIAMTCLYGGILGTVAINQNLANMSSNGKRVAVSKTPKGRLILSSVIASYIVQLIGLALLFVYTVFVLKVDYGENLLLIILLGLARVICRFIAWDRSSNFS